ncbi:tRNA (adenosine(37)-N6)-threonylcarbamoyltransferase complex transferase subunit TsaD [Ampullimonas aquatilis]|uniref:tRNA (adenosine(37)-N6)-threonylcarbamoyltransferase complex transferase subunit TsaD n=1 Tax=Ampullimonas aquatilis TaxID=1341549 RepID=UPI003C709C37
MIVLGIESSCDETGLALFKYQPNEQGQYGELLAHALHSQISMHMEYGGVVPELASRDHIQRLIPLLEDIQHQSGLSLDQIDAIAYTKGPGLAGALLVGSSLANALAMSLNKPVIGIHHLEGHLLSPLLSSKPPIFSFVALLVSGGHTQLMSVTAMGNYSLLGETLDDAAGEAFDKTAKLLDLSYPGGPAVAKLAEQGQAGQFKFPRPMLHSDDLDFSFSGLKTAVLTEVRKLGANMSAQDKANIALAFQEAAVDVLCKKSLRALQKTNMKRLVVAGGVGANRHLREQLDQMALKNKIEVYYPELHLCTDNGAMIAFAGAMRLAIQPEQATHDYQFDVKPRWNLAEIQIAKTTI